MDNWTAYNDTFFITMCAMRAT